MLNCLTHFIIFTKFSTTVERKRISKLLNKCQEIYLKILLLLKKELNFFEREWSSLWFRSFWIYMLFANVWKGQIWDRNELVLPPSPLGFSRIFEWPLTPKITAGWHFLHQKEKQLEEWPDKLMEKRITVSFITRHASSTRRLINIFWERKYFLWGI